MRSTTFLLALALVPAWAQIKPIAAAAPAPVKPGEMPHIAWPVLAALEKSLDVKISTARVNDPMMLLGNTTGVYIAGYGVVFTLAIDLVLTPVPSPFNQHPDMTGVHQRKLDNLPVLEQTMREMWLAFASKLTTIPDNEQIVIAVRPLYHPEEDTRNLPGQLIVRAERRALATRNLQVEAQ
jgi:hypothetical protein